MNSCVSCGRSWTGPDGKIHCGAPVDDAGLQGDAEGLNPIWAERKYGKMRIMLMLAGGTTNDKGTDCEDMDPADGATCKMWKPWARANGDQP